MNFTLDSKYTVTDQGRVEVLFVSLLITKDDGYTMYYDEFYNSEFDLNLYGKVKDDFARLLEYPSFGAFRAKIEESDTNLKDIADEFSRIYEGDMNTKVNSELVLNLLMEIGEWEK